MRMVTSQQQSPSWRRDPEVASGDGDLDIMAARVSKCGRGSVEPVSREHYPVAAPTTRFGQ